jgi:superoxide dismutase, Fe-Mn family
MPYQLPSLGFAYDALEPHIDARTVEIHHAKHHQTYLNNLNKALESAPELFNQAPADLLKDLTAIPQAIRTAVRNHGGGFVNHNFYWEALGPNAGGEPQGALAEALVKAFGTFAAFKEKLTAASVGHFGSGWGWLSLDKAGQLVVHSTPNQDSPLSEGFTPLVTCDVWEHAYYLKYQNLRASYVGAWWSVVKWDVVAARYAAALK